MPNSSSYPGALDSFGIPPATLAGPESHHNLTLWAWDAIEKLQAELGINGRYRTLRSVVDEAARDTDNPSPLDGHCAVVGGKEQLQIYYDADGSWWGLPRMLWDRDWETDRRVL